MCAHSPSQRPMLIGLPRREQEPLQRRWQGWIISLLAHLLLVLLIIVSPYLEPEVAYERAQGAGGAGPAGGGGGGQQGGGERLERLHYVQTAPTASSAAVPAPVPTPVPVPPKPVVPPKPPETPVPVSRPPVAAPAQPAAPEAPSAPVASGVGQGAGAGAGTSSGAGAGTGTGGGVGSGEGTGRGSGVGAGTGGGTATNYPPTPRQVFLPPLPAPGKVRGFRMIAWFDVDSTGKATLLRFTPSPDAGYNKKLRETLLAMKFRPAVRPDGRPLRDTVDVEFVF